MTFQVTARNEPVRNDFLNICRQIDIIPLFIYNISVMKKVISVFATVFCSFILFGTAVWAGPADSESAARASADPAYASSGSVKESAEDKVDDEVYKTVRDILDNPLTHLTSSQRLLLEACARIPAAKAGYCATWVSRVYACLGVAVSGNANDMWANCCTQDDITDLAPGMLIAVERCGTDRSSDGYIYGHVGIYLGDSKVIDSHSAVVSSADGTAEVRGINAVVSLEDWLKAFDTYSTARWGYPEGFMDLLDLELLSLNPVIIYADLPAAEFVPAEDTLTGSEGSTQTEAGDPQTIKYQPSDDTVLTCTAAPQGFIPAAENAACITWDRVYGADGYYVFRDDYLIAKIPDSRQNYYIDTDRPSDEDCAYHLYSYKSKGSKKPVYLSRIPDPTDPLAGR